jgi:hypothetical protein
MCQHTIKKCEVSLLDVSWDGSKHMSKQTWAIWLTSLIEPLDLSTAL